MKNSHLKLAVSGFLLSSFIGHAAHSQVSMSCKNLFSNSFVENSAPYPTFNLSLSTDQIDIESKMSSLNSQIENRKTRRESLEKDLKTSSVWIPMHLKTDALKALESLLKTEKETLESEGRRLRFAKLDLVDGYKHLESKKTPGLLKKFGRIGEKRWTETEVEELAKRIETLETNEPVRKENIAYYSAAIAELEIPLKAVALKSKSDELKDLVSQDEKAQLKIQELKIQKGIMLEKSREQASAIFKEALKDARLSSTMHGLLGFHALKNLPTDNKVTLLVGNNISGSLRIEYHQAVQVRELVQNLVKRRFYVVFDAESAYAPFISHMAGEYGIPVMSKEQPKFADHKNKVVISNDYLKMQILSKSKAVISTPDSITGMGLYMEGLVTHVLDVQGKFEISTLRSWTADLDKRSRNLGITEKSTKIVKTVESIFEKPEYSFGISKTLNDDVAQFKNFQKLDETSLNAEDMKTVIKEATSFAKVMEQNNGSGGSVIFGSSKEDSHSANLIYQSAYKLGRLGIAVVTGGSSGAMEIANSGAYNAGGVSIGIPIGGKHTLDTENSFATSSHTKTIMTSGYEERIPALLGEGKDSRKFIIFAPGGNGTIKELATTLVRASGKLSSFQKIVFLDADYYRPLVEWLMKSSLPQALKDKIVLINTADEMEKIAMEAQEPFEKERIQEPRKDKTSYSVKTTSKYDTWPYKKSDEFPKFNGGGDKGKETTTVETTKKKNKNKYKAPDKVSQPVTAPGPVVPGNFGNMNEEQNFYRQMYDGYGE